MLNCLVVLRVARQHPGEQASGYAAPSYFVLSAVLWVVVLQFRLLSPLTLTGQKQKFILFLCKLIMISKHDFIKAAMDLCS